MQSLTHTSDYVYQSLETPDQATSGLPRKPLIRLLELLPGVPGDELNCKLLHTSLNDHVDYEALSYTWGSLNRPHNIMCNGYSIPVTDTLQEVLITLRYEKGKRILWIDQVCMWECYPWRQCLTKKGVSAAKNDGSGNLYHRGLSVRLRRHDTA